MTQCVCKSCGCNKVVNYCPECGEVVLTPELRSSWHIAKDFTKEITSVDGNLARTLRLLIFSPGALDYEYHIGRRKLYIKPITLFLLINVLYVMFATLTDFFVNFSSQMTMQIYSDLIRPLVISYLDFKNWDIAEFGKLYDQLVIVLARSLIILQVPIFALFTGLICYQKRYFSGDYVTFSLNYHSVLLIIFVVSAYPDWLFEWINSTQVLPFELPMLQLWLILLLPILYGMFAIRYLFGFSWLQVAWRILLLQVAYLVTHGIYRFLQFLITASLIDM